MNGLSKLASTQIFENGPALAIREKKLGVRNPMTLKIERISGKRRTRIRLSGDFRSDRLDQVKAEINCGGPVALDLEEVDLVDVEAVRFLNAREDDGIAVLHCSPYIRKWMLREREEEKRRTDWR